MKIVVGIIPESSQEHGAWADAPIKEADLELTPQQFSERFLLAAYMACRKAIRNSNGS